MAKAKNDDVKKGDTSTQVLENAKKEDLEVVDSTPTASGNQLTEVRTGRVSVPGAAGGEQETTSIQTDGPVSDKQKENSKESPKLVTGKYTRRQPMTSIRKIEYFDVAGSGNSKDKVSHDQLVSNIEQGQRYIIKMENGKAQELKVVNTPWGKVVTTEDNSEVTTMTGPNFEEFVQDPSEEELAELEKAKKAKKSDLKKDYGGEETSKSPEEETTSVAEGNTLAEREVKDLKTEEKRESRHK